MSTPVTIEDIYKLFQKSQEDFDRRMAESDRRAAEAKAESDRRAADFDRLAAESRAENDRRKREIDQQLKELGKQIGGLGAKFGSFTEGLALPSMQKILGDRFGMEVISPSVRISKLGQHLEIDVLAYANSDINQAYVVEVKSHPREDSILQLKAILNKFRDFFPEHKDKQVYGILAAVDLPANLKDKILQEGLYVARISDDTFEMDTPDNFCPRVW